MTEHIRELFETKLTRVPDVFEIKPEPWCGLDGLQSAIPRKFILPSFSEPDFDNFLRSIETREVLVRTGNYGDPDNDKRTRFAEYKPIRELLEMLQTYRQIGGEFNYPPGAPNQISSWKEIYEFFGLSFDVLKSYGTINLDHNSPPRYWISPKGGVTGLHYDTRDNLIIQLTGVKRWILLSPKFYKYAQYRMNLPPMAIEGKVIAHYGDDDKLELLRTYSPTLRKDDPREWDKTIVMELHPGEALHLPAFWGHHVEVLEDTLNINQWWDSVYSLGYKHEEKGKPLEKLKKERSNEVSRSLKYLKDSKL